MLLGIDTGGTFTDFVYYNGRSTRLHKVLSTPNAPGQSIVRGIREMGIDLKGLRIIHGSTLATNAVLEGKGARTVYITNRGLKDLLTIGRQARRELYNLQPRRIAPPVPEDLCLETGGRISADGEVIEPLTDTDLAMLIQQVQKLKPRSVAINLLFSFLDNHFERMIADALPDDLFISCSSEVLPEYREYERGITTWLNAYVGPLIQGYLRQLRQQLSPALLSVMRSSGNTCDAEQAGRESVHLLFSGPAGGLNGARYIAALTGNHRLLTFDMGGTSTDVALIDGDIGLTGQGVIGRYPVGVPMVDIHTIGAGGGSIAYVDAGGVLQVGPQSADAIPGPACYGQGGREPTVTDANLVLGYLPRGTLLCGSIPLAYEHACQVLEPLIMPLGLDSIEMVAEGIIRIANEHMVQALRVISIQRGIDPREFVLVAFGGAGGLHVCALAGTLDMHVALVPIHAGVLSALGMLVAPPGRQLSRTLGLLLRECREQDVTFALNELADKGKAALTAEGIDPGKIKFIPTLDLCYRGQSFTLNIPWQNLQEAEADFHRRHETQFGHRLDEPVELINVRLGVIADSIDITLPVMERQAAGPCTYGTVYGLAEPVAIWPHDSLTSNQIVVGPAIITTEISTTYVAPAWQCQMDKVGNLLLQRS